ncbi:MAG: LysM peptidoglycan-binding domain-containing protein, partial [Oscillospiraceae bacterium]|nr:LysM peptidoglycan-binding domain-containing protein [Oscillospiraceae bacterium]
MKKKLLAMLLTLCMVTAMVAGLGISAYAADDISADTTVGYIIPYKLASGDTVAKVCQKLGVDFSAKQAEISRINAITDYTKLAVGKVVWIPVTSVGTATDYYTLKAHVVANGDTLAGICAQYGVATGDALLSRLNNATITVGSTLTVPVFKGDTKTAIVTPGSAAPTTPAVSGGTVISTGTTTGAGTTVTGDTVAYYLIPYTMKAGDTVLKVCNTLGIDFAANQNLITRANNITSYSTIPVGRTLLLPCT